MSERHEELRRRLEQVTERIDRACRDADRDAGEVNLVVVTKFFPASDVRILADLGVTDVGENRHQEAEAKAHECADLNLRWHYIGGLQSNKAAAVASYADVVESVDRRKLLSGLVSGAQRTGRESLDILLQVSLDGLDATSRSGAAPSELLGLAQAVTEQEVLNLRGLMAVAPLGQDPHEAFSRLADIRSEWLTSYPRADWLSAGMSGDLEAAIKIGATHVRVGSAVLGSRPSVQ